MQESLTKKAMVSLHQNMKVHFTFVFKRLSGNGIYDS